MTFSLQQAAGIVRCVVAGEAVGAAWRTCFLSLSLRLVSVILVACRNILLNRRQLRDEALGLVQPGLS